MDSLLSCFGQVYFFFARAGARTRTSHVKIALILCSIFTTPSWSDTISLTPPSQNTANSVPVIDPKLQTNLDKVSDPKTQICLPAIDALGHSQNPVVIPGLAQAFKAENRALVRRYIVDALGQLRNPAALPTFALALKDQDVQLRQSTIAALGLMGTPQAQAMLVAQASVEKSPAVKAHLAHHLRFVPTSDATNALHKLQQDKDPNVKRKADESMTYRQTGAR